MHDPVQLHSHLLLHPGTPHVEVGVGSLPIIAIAAAGMLVAGKPIRVTRKEVGGWRLHLGLPRQRPAAGEPYTLEPAVRGRCMLGGNDCATRPCSQAHGFTRSRCALPGTLRSLAFPLLPCPAGAGCRGPACGQGPGAEPGPAQRGVASFPVTAELMWR